MQFLSDSSFGMKEETLVPGTLRGYRRWILRTSYSNSMEDPFMMEHGVGNIIYSTDWLRKPWGAHSYLWSVGHVKKWPIKGIEARCQLRSNISKKTVRLIDPKFEVNHEAPNLTCECGAYGYYYAHKAERHKAGPYSIGGAFEAWGKIVLGTEGFRCQHAKVVALVQEPPSGFTHVLRGWATHVAAHYGVPLFSSWRDLRHEFPESDVSELIPKTTPKPKW